MKNQYIDDLVSVIVPVYNAEAFIEKTINCVLAQTYQTIELLLIDDCSKDQSEAIISKYMYEGSPVVYHRLAVNSGAAVARNEGLRLAKGRYIAFLDSDDTWSKEKLEKQIYQMKKTGAAFSFTAYDMVDPNGVVIKEKIKIKPRLKYKDLLTKTMIATPAVMFDRYQTGEIFMPNRRTGQDYAFWLLLMRNFDAYGIDEALTHVCRRKNSLSKSKLQNIRDVWEVQTINENIGKIRAAVHVIRYCIYTVRKRYF